MAVMIAYSAASRDTRRALMDTIGDGVWLPDDIAALAATLQDDRRSRARRALRAARATAQRLPTWRDTAKKFVQAIEAAA
jgi:hypothetical protein